MTQDVSIRRGVSSDAALLASLGERTFLDTFAAHCAPEDMAAYLSEAFTHSRLVEELADSSATFFVAEVGGEAAGYAKLAASAPPECVTGEKPIELVRLYVDQRWHGTGVGQSLMQTCVDEARRAGFRTMWLGVWERNYRAQAFYLKWGFCAVGEHIFQLGSDAQTDLLMEKQV